MEADTTPNAIADRLQPGSDTWWAELERQRAEAKAIADGLVEEMEAAGYTVTVRQANAAATTYVRVKCQVDGTTVYNVQTSATSGYTNAVAAAYAKWKQHRAEGGEA